MSFWDFHTEIVAIDSGSNYLRIATKEKLVFNEPNQISIDTTTGKILGIGHSASKTKNSAIIKPVNYVPADFHAFEMTVRLAVKNIVKSFIPKSLITYWSIPTNITEVDKRAYRDSAEHAYSKQTYLVYQATSAAIAMGILFEKKHFIIIDFSASKIEISVFSDSTIRSTGILPLGTWKIEQLIKNYVWRTYQIQLTETNIENIYKEMGEDYNTEIEIQYVRVSLKGIQELLQNYFSLANDLILQAIENLPDDPHIEKIIHNGVYFTGGGSTIDYLRSQINLNGIKSTLSKNPFLDNINGLRIIMADKEKFKNHLMT